VAADRPLGEDLIRAWRTTNKATTFLIEQLPAAIWESGVPGMPRQTVRGVAAHLHNSRCRWIKALGRGHGVEAPRFVDLRRVSARELVRALARSSKGIEALIRLGMASGGRVPRTTWQNFPPDLDHFLTYFVAHEAHHRGQLILISRQLGYRLPLAVAAGVWQWNRFSRESR
jgi:uncharacterized damage-inducible protein DinB